MVNESLLAVLGMADGSARAVGGFTCARENA